MKDGFRNVRKLGSDEFSVCCQVIIQFREKSKIAWLRTCIAIVNCAGEVTLPTLKDGDAGFLSAQRYCLNIARRAATIHFKDMPTTFLENVNANPSDKAWIYKVRSLVGLHFPV